jgi:hypothetical protein
MSNYYNTLDLDKIDKYQLLEIVNKIKMQECCEAIQVKDSFSKGYHVLLTCREKCDKCRMVFDDAKRFSMDSMRDEKFQNTLFTSKEYVRGNLRTISNKCDTCFQHGALVSLSKKTLDYKTFKKKYNQHPELHIWNPKLIFVGYDYLECPICKWFKFVKTGVSANKTIEAFGLGEKTNDIKKISKI